MVTSSTLTQVLPMPQECAPIIALPSNSTTCFTAGSEPRSMPGSKPRSKPPALTAASQLRMGGTRCYNHMVIFAYQEILGVVPRMTRLPFACLSTSLPLVRRIGRDSMHGGRWQLGAVPSASEIHSVRAQVHGG